MQDKGYKERASQFATPPASSGNTGSFGPGWGRMVLSCNALWFLSARQGRRDIITGINL